MIVSLPPAGRHRLHLDPLLLDGRLQCQVLLAPSLPGERGRMLVPVGERTGQVRLQYKNVSNRRIEISI